MTNSVSKTIANIRNRLDSAEKSLVRKAFLQNEITISSANIEIQNGPIVIEEENISDTVGLDKPFADGTLDNPAIRLDAGDTYSVKTYKVLNPDNLYRNYLSQLEVNKLVDLSVSTATISQRVLEYDLVLQYDFASAAVSTLVVDEVVPDQTSYNNDGALYGFTANNGTCYGGVTILSDTMSFDGVDDYVDCGNDTSLNPTDEITVEGWMNSLSDNFLPSSSSDWLTGWSYRKKITIDHTKIDSDLTDFPVLVKLDSTNFDFTKSNSDGFDIRFTSSDGTTLLKFERERHDSTNQKAEYWVKIPSISSTADTVFYMYYRTEDTVDGSDASNVWSNGYVAVYHLSNNSNDSTANNKDGTDYSMVYSSTAGKINIGADFTDGSRYISVPNTVSAPYYTISAWAKLNSSSSSSLRIFRMGVKSGCGPSSQDFMFYNNSTGTYVRSSVGCENQPPTGVSYTSGTWVYVAYTTNGTGTSTHKRYFNGVPIGTLNWGDRYTLSWDYQEIGAYWSGGVHYYSANSYIDEVRISSVARSDAWIKASYYSESNNLNTYGATEEPSPDMAAGILKSGSYGIGATTTKAYALINDKVISGDISSGWNHIVMTYDKSQIKLYANNTLLTTADYSEPIATTSNNLQIGNLFEGYIDEVRIYNRALSAEEIQAEYSAGRGNYAISNKGLVAQYSGKDYAGTESAPTTIYDTNRLTKGRVDGSKALWFDGVDDYIKTPDNASLNFTSGTEIEGWILIPDYADIQDGDFVLNKPDAYQIQLGSAGMTAVFKNSSGTASTVSATQAQCPDGEWVHFKVTYVSGEGSKLYINDTFIGSGSDVGDIAATTGDLTFAEHTQLKLSDMQISNIALTGENTQINFQPGDKVEMQVYKDPAADLFSVRLSIDDDVLDNPDNYVYEVSPDGRANWYTVQNRQSREFSDAETGHDLWLRISAIGSGTISLNNSKYGIRKAIKMSYILK